MKRLPAGRKQQPLRSSNGDNEVKPFEFQMILPAVERGRPTYDGGRRSEPAEAEARAAPSCHRSPHRGRYHRHASQAPMTMRRQKIVRRSTGVGGRNYQTASLTRPTCFFTLDAASTAPDAALMTSAVIAATANGFNNAG